MMQKLPAVLVGCALATIASTAQSVTPHDISVGAGVQALLGTEDIILTDRIAQPWSGPTGLAIERTANAGDGMPYSVSSFARVDAVWTSATAGSVDVNWGWDVQSAGSGLLTAARTGLAPELAGQPANWSYSFTASRDGTFSARWTLDYIGDDFGLGFLRFDGIAGPTALPQPGGTLVRPLAAGTTYTLTLSNFGNVFQNVPAGFNRSDQAFGQVDWSIRIIPEPATWAMMIAGFGLVGSVLRLRRARPRASRATPATTTRQTAPAR